MTDLIGTLTGRPGASTPVWLMRQAGRYLPEYRAFKERYSFWEMVRTPEIAAEVTLQPLQRFPLDAAILFSDIMTPLPAMGVSIDFAPGPVIAAPVRTAAEVARLRMPEPGEIAPFVTEAVGMIRRATTAPLIGFAGAPLTLAAYLVQGGGGGDYATFRAWLRAEPDTAQALLNALTEVTIRYLRLQIDAGVQVVQVFDSWAGVLDRATYARFGEPLLRTLFSAVADVPRIYLAVGAAHLYPLIAGLPVEAVSVDWRLPLDTVRGALPGLVLQGNLDPAVMLAPGEVVEAAAGEVLRAGAGGAHVFNLGHGLLPSTPPDNVARLVDAVHAFRGEEACRTPTRSSS